MPLDLVSALQVLSAMTLPGIGWFLRTLYREAREHAAVTAAHGARLTGIETAVQAVDKRLARVETLLDRAPYG